MATTRQPRKAQSSTWWPKRGEIYLTALDPTVGNEIKKTRPALIIQNNTTNRYGRITMVAPITSTVRLPLSPLHVLLPADSTTGLSVPSVAVMGQIRAVDRSRLIKRLGQADAVAMLQVDQAIGIAFGLTEIDLELESPPAFTETVQKGANGFISAG
jgi:mRNA interferase MazF